MLRAKRSDHRERAGGKGQRREAVTTATAKTGAANGVGLGTEFTVNCRGYIGRRFKVMQILGDVTWSIDLNDKISSRTSTPAQFGFHKKYFEYPEVKILENTEDLIEKTMAAVEFIGAGDPVPYDAGTEGLSFQTGKGTVE